MGERRLVLALLVALVALAALPAAAGAVVLHTQQPTGPSTVTTVPSFDFANDVSDNRAGDDFTVPAGQTWTPTKITAVGLAASGSAGTSAVSVVIYSDAGGVPGDVLYSAGGLPGATCAVGANCTQAVGLSGAPRLAPGKYWISVQSAAPYQWFWGVVPPGQILGSPAVWQNPGDGFGRGCTTYKPLVQCGWTTATGGTELIYSLEGEFTNSNFQLGRVTSPAINGVGIAATFPAAGAAVVRDVAGLPGSPKKLPTYIKKVRVNVQQGKTKLPIRFTPLAVKRLRSGKTLRTKIAVVYTAQGGVPVTLRVKQRFVLGR